MQNLESNMVHHDSHVGALRHGLLARRQRAAYVGRLGNFGVMDSFLGGDPYGRVPLPYNSALPLGISSRPDPYLASGKNPTCVFGTY